MNRLRVLKQRANRCGAYVLHCNGRYMVVSGCDYRCDVWAAKSRREAIFLASRCALPVGPLKVSQTHKDGSVVHTTHHANGRVRIRHEPSKEVTDGQVDGSL